MGWARIQGKRVLFPLGFYCTSIAIKAYADKLVREVKIFRKFFKGYKEEDITDKSKVEAVPIPI